MEWMREQQYEGLPASSAIAMAVMERSGMRAMIDSLVKHAGDRKLTPGMAVKAMIGPIFDARKKMPLSGVRHFYSAAPTDLLFGDGVTMESLNDNALARNLDDLYDHGLEKLFWGCSSMLKRRYGFDSKIRHMDSTNYTIHAIGPDNEGRAVPAFGGNAKDGRNDLLQYCAATVTDGDRILEYSKAYSGNTADPVMDRETLEFLKRSLVPSENTVIADCKLVNTSLITEMNDMGMGFISKLPAIFSDKVKEKVISSASSGVMDVSSLSGYETYETEHETVCGKLRFIVYRSPGGIRKEMEYLKRQGRCDAEKRFKVFSKKKFACEADARLMFGEILGKHRDNAYIVSGEPIRTDEIIRRDSRGRPPKGTPSLGTRPYWKMDVSMEFSESRAIEIANVRSLSVIVTNLPFCSADDENIRYGATTDTVLRLYLDQYKVEHTYRLMKSGMGVDSVYVHTPSRANALLFVVSVATLISSVMDAVLRRGARHKTVKQICIEMQNALIEYVRGRDAMRVLGPKGSSDSVLSYLSLLGMDPSILLEIDR